MWSQQKGERERVDDLTNTQGYLLQEEERVVVAEVVGQVETEGVGHAVLLLVDVRVQHNLKNK